MKAEPLIASGIGYRRCEVREATHVRIHKHGYFPNQVLPIILKGKREGTNCWSWNGDTEKPTIKPSIKTSDGKHICHTWINDGKVIYLEDCTHQYAGQTLDLLDID